MLGCYFNQKCQRCMKGFVVVMVLGEPLQRIMVPLLGATVLYVWVVSCCGEEMSLVLYDIDSGVLTASLVATLQENKNPKLANSA